MTGIVVGARGLGGLAGLLLGSVSQRCLHHATVPTVVLRVLHGGAVGRIVVGAGDDADLVVVGSRGLGTWDRLMLGSVASHVALHARVAVAVVPAAGANDTDLPDTSSARSSS